MEKHYDIQEEFEKRIEKSFEDKGITAFDFLTESNKHLFYKIDGFIQGNDLQYLQYSNFIHSISQEEVNKMDKDNLQKYRFTLEQVDKRDLDILESLLGASKVE